MAKIMHIEATAVLCASFSPSGNVLVALGALTQPRLCTLDITGETTLPTSVTLPNDKNAPNTDTPIVASELALPKVLGPNEFGGSKRPSTEDTLNPSKRTRNEKDVGANVTMEERLAGLASQLHQLESPAASAENNAAPAPTSDSLVTLVDEALQTGDDALLEQCFSCEDADFVEETSRRLPTGRIVLLLRRLVSKFEKRPSRGLLLTRWLAALLRHHTAYLVSVPDLTAQLAGLSQMLEQRLSSYSRLASLGGRLDLLLSRVSTVGSHQMVQEPLVVVRE
jgi:U3 small nucleolar RNA-associated protein 5